MPVDSVDPKVARIVAEIRADLDSYLLDLGGPDPWGYAHYHCGTAANAYGKVHSGIGEEWIGIPRVEVVGDPFAGEFVPA